MAEKPTVLILGGCGFIGRHLVCYLVENELTQEIRVVDKTPPQIAWLNERQTRAYDNAKLDFFSANLINDDSRKRAFAPHPTTGRSWDLVINCAAETNVNLDDSVYREGIFQLSVDCANEAARIKAQRYVELSSGCMNSNESTPLAENCPVEPWTCLAKYKAAVEEALADVVGLSYTIVRLPLVYGVGDKRYLTPRIIIAGIYKYLGETMQLVWGESLRLSTVHVTDVCMSIWQLAQSPRSAGETYNIVDDSESTQGTITALLADIFDIRVDYFGSAKSLVVKMSLSLADTINDINQKHVDPWQKVCQADNIYATPLIPNIYTEQLGNNHLNLDGSKLKEFGYVLKFPKVTRELLMEIINDYAERNLFPKLLLP